MTAKHLVSFTVCLSRRLQRGYNGVEQADSHLPGTAIQIVFAHFAGAAIRGICTLKTILTVHYSVNNDSRQTDSKTAWCSLLILVPCAGPQPHCQPVRFPSAPRRQLTRNIIPEIEHELCNLEISSFFGTIFPPIFAVFNTTCIYWHCLSKGLQLVVRIRKYVPQGRDETQNVPDW